MADIYAYRIPKDIIGSTLIELAQENDSVVVLSSDVSVSCNIEEYHQRFPRRFFEMGIAEQSTMSVAGGLAAEGLTPVYVALSIFSCCMTWPQTRQICNANLNVKIIGTHAGVDDGQDGTGHHATEDIAISRVLPRMTVMTPSDENETAAALRAAVEMDGPVYMRVAREPQPMIHASGSVFEVGKAEVIFDDGNDFAIVYEGSALRQALEGWESLKEKGKRGKLISIRTVKPLDAALIKKIAYTVPIIITVENHSIVGGLYSAISEELMHERADMVLRPVGFSDTFTESGVPSDIKKKYGLSGEAILRTYEDFAAQACSEHTDL